jgi:hypothetical protein
VRLSKTVVEAIEPPSTGHLVVWDVPIRDAPAAGGSHCRVVSMRMPLTCCRAWGSPPPHQEDDHTGAGKGWRLAAFLLFGCCDGERTRVAHVIQVVSIQPSDRWTCEVRNSLMWSLRG